jgi:steroid 5-alpha reductase family enzyme
MSALAVLVGSVGAYMCVWFVVGTILKRNDVADIAWGLGFVLVTWVGFALSARGLHSVIVALLVTIWGIRLSTHIAVRARKKGHEDPRYATWRKEWKHVVLRSFFQIYVLQGALLLLIATPIIFIHLSAPVAGTTTLIVGACVWLLGFAIEVVADRQLRAFLLSRTAKSPQLCMIGLWKYSRHPNYFGEAVLWWGIFLITVDLPGSLWMIASPLLITFLLRFVSGVPLAERRYQGREDFEVYKRRTNAFVPWFPG